MAYALPVAEYERRAHLAPQAPWPLPMPRARASSGPWPGVLAPAAGRTRSCGHWRFYAMHPRLRVRATSALVARSWKLPPGNYRAGKRNGHGQDSGCAGRVALRDPESCHYDDCDHYGQGLARMRVYVTMRITAHTRLRPDAAWLGDERQRQLRYSCACNDHHDHRYHGHGRYCGATLGGSFIFALLNEAIPS